MDVRRDMGREVFELVGGLGVVIYQRDLGEGGRVRYLNPGSEALTGYLPDALLEHGASYFDLVVADDRERLESTVRAVARDGGGDFQATYRLQTDDGSERWVLDRGCLRRNGEGEWTVVGIATDLEPEEVERSTVQQRRRKLSELMSHLPSVVYRARNHPNWTMEFLSDGCASLTGYEEAQLVDDRDVAYAELVHPEDRDRIWFEAQHALKEYRPFKLTYRLRTAQGQEKWVWEQGVGVYGGRGEAVAVEGFITDVTARKRTEHTLSSSQHALARLVNHLPGMAYRCTADEEPMFEFVSEGCHELTGYPSSQLIYNNAVRYHDLVIGPDRPRVRAALQHSARTGAPFSLVYRIVSADGSEKRICDRGRGVPGANGQIAVIEGFATEGGFVPGE